ncbi:MULTISPECIES: hypothetical protein [unclassified Bacillus (in: firmicutes)]|nr:MULTISPECIES: hypothetical protein [unclassified Bacillus (in: firmicutes)]
MEQKIEKLVEKLQTKVKAANVKGLITEHLHASSEYKRYLAAVSPEF